MKLIAIKCFICDSWRGSFRNHCPICGAYRIGHKHYRFDGMMLARVFPKPLHRIIAKFEEKSA